MDFVNITPQWLENKYNEFNQMYFDNQLGGCYFGIFTTGKGSKGHTLGHFFMNVPKGNLKRERYTNKIYYINPQNPYDKKHYVNKDNFFTLTNPTIELNGNYRWTEQGAEDTLIHEMCHYYTYMNGYAPTQGHGVEFRSIAAKVSNESNGRFTIKRLASAEELTRIELDPTIKAQNDQRKQRKMNKCVVALLYTDNNEVRLVLAADLSLINEITRKAELNSYKPKILQIKASADDQLKQLLIDNHYSAISRTYRYWPIQDKPIYQQIKDGHFEFATVYKYKPEENKKEEFYTKGELFPEPIQKQNPDIIPHFKFTTMNGNTIEFRNISKEGLFNQLKSKFPKWPDQNIKRIMDNPNYNLGEK